MTLNEFLKSKSPEFNTKFNNALLQACKKIITKDSILQYFEDNDINMTYAEVSEIELFDILDYFAYDIGDQIENLVPKDIFLNEMFLDQIIDLLSEGPAESYLYRVWNDILLPLTKDKIQYLKTLNDKIGDEHTTEIKDIDIHNREVPFLIIGDDIYIGQHYYEHADISNELLEKGINDKDVAILYGHMVDGIGFIDLNRTINPSKIDMNKLKSIVANEPKLLKMYTHPENYKITRVARRLMRKVDI